MATDYFTLITGASEGLGKQLALECARRQHNLVLVALPGSGLTQLAALIQSNHGVQVVCLEKELSTEKACFDLYSILRERSVSINCLINNAGISGSAGFAENDVHFYARQLAVNLTAPTLLTRIFLPDLCRHAPAYVLNVVGLDALLCRTNKPVESATSSYLLQFSKALSSELRKQNISVTVVCPETTDSPNDLQAVQPLQPNRVFRRPAMHPARVARTAVAGMLKKKKQIVPGLRNRLLLAFGELWPGWLKLRLIRRQRKPEYPVQRSPFKRSGNKPTTAV